MQTNLTLGTSTLLIIGAGTISLALLSPANAVSNETTIPMHHESEMLSNLDWNTINDDVMGGRSASVISNTPQGIIEFSGNLSLENNGGFASMRAESDWSQSGEAVGVRLKLKGDGRRYKFTIRCAGELDWALYRHEFASKAGSWQTVTLPFAGFKAGFRGRPLPSAPKIKSESIVEIGFLISDKKAGPFKLQIAEIAPVHSLN